MSPVFGVVPKEVPVQRALDFCAPDFVRRVRLMMADLEGGPPEMVFETLRTEERQTFLYEFGRSYDDGRGIVTRAKSALYSWHGFGMAIDVVEKDATPWQVPDGFWDALGTAAEKHGLVWGGRWTKPDRPHVQAGGLVPVSPTDDDRALYHAHGLSAVWKKYELLKAA